jgi:flagellar protein FliJ
MSRFRFRLQTLQRLRETTRDDLRARLAEAYQAERILAEQRAAVAAETAALAEAQRRLMIDGALDVTRLLESQRYQRLLEARSRTLAEQTAKLADEIESRRQAVVEADRQVRVLDKLHERRRREHQDAEQAAESRRLDEIAVTRWEAAPS